jgi:hypothetical protein
MQRPMANAQHASGAARGAQDGTLATKICPSAPGVRDRPRVTLQAPAEVTEASQVAGRR